MRVTGYDTGGFYDEMFDDGVAAAPRGAAPARHDPRARRRPARTLPAGRRAHPRPARHHLQRLRRLGRHRAAVPLRPGAAHRHGRRSGTGSSAGSSSASTRSTSSSTTSITSRRSSRTGSSPRRSSARRRSTGRSASASTRRRASGATSPAPTWCATPTARSTCSRTTCACRRACPTCSRTAT